MAPPLRTRVAAAAGRAVSGASRRIGAGEGSVIGGRVTLALDPQALTHLTDGQTVAIVSGTNGKTTTTRLLAAALATSHRVTSNTAGANLVPGLVSAFSASRAGSWAAIEVDEGFVGLAVRTIRPGVATLLNLSRDQLDRIGEVRVHAASWGEALARAPMTTAVANADDPLVVWAAGRAERVVWVGTGQCWRADAAACPACGSRIRWDAEPPSPSPPPASEDAGSHWACGGCPLARPSPAVTLDGDTVVLADGRHLDLTLALPGRCNRANAAMAAGAAFALDPRLDPPAVAQAMSEVRTVEGRYEVRRVGARFVRLLLAKNPAGWAEALELVRPTPVDLVLGINARTADGRDPSWLWDVEFERLAGRRVIATGDRGLDLAVRLRYAGVDHEYVVDHRGAVGAAQGPEIDLVANYTSFQDARASLR